MKVYQQAFYIFDNVIVTQILAKLKHCVKIANNGMCIKPTMLDVQ